MKTTTTNQYILSVKNGSGELIPLLTFDTPDALRSFHAEFASWYRDTRELMESTELT